MPAHDTNNVSTKPLSQLPVGTKSGRHQNESLTHHGALQWRQGVNRLVTGVGRIIIEVGSSDRSLIPDVEIVELVALEMGRQAS